MKEYFPTKETVVSRGGEPGSDFKRHLNLGAETINLNLNPGAFDEG